METINTFFEITDKSLHNHGYAWASGYGPLEENSMKFLHPSQLERNREYWKINNEVPENGVRVQIIDRMGGAFRLGLWRGAYAFNIRGLIIM
ncbi:hypothetical protein EI77_02305 [Prosthecobacter fusiformis]|uniref:Uncharacterized protein n=1 Tax=Prosthecobacter fusiformis TaxID=48464 RepID=A0A4V3FFK9_9BACT|nr:hypothetical protein [Prosthecobacter fusiformis]TDU71183.1 hypothetical protein EI77_02305 [Prosthecobacter fusiformis]